MKTLMEKEIFESPGALERTLSQNDGSLTNIAAALRQSSSVFFAARGTSSHAALYGKYLLETLAGIPVGFVAPSVTTVFGRAMDYSRSTVIGISQSGAAEDVRRVLENAKASGAYTVAITNNASSPLAAVADAHIDICAGSEKSVAATKTFTCSLFVLAMLAAQCAKDDALSQALPTVPGLVEKALGLAPDMQSLAPRYRFMNECFTLARGYDSCMALEAALKMQECAYIRAKAYSTSDFVHGPIAMVEQNTPCFAYAGRGLFTESVDNMLDRLRHKGADITVFSDDESLQKKADVALPLPTPAHPALMPLSITPAIQLFACYVALGRNLTPDTPRGLSKITITV